MREREKQKEIENLFIILNVLEFQSFNLEAYKPRLLIQ